MVSEEILAAREEVITAMEAIAAEYGLPRSVGQVYGVLYFADGALSLDSLAERSGYAKSTASDAVHTLETLYLARQTSRPAGGRRAYFEAERDLWTAFNRIAVESGRREIDLMQRALANAEEQLESVDGGTADLDRVKNLQATYEQMATMLAVLENADPEELIDALEQTIDSSGSTDGGLP
ncbi:GbsR/MarR family transcriptional regulator [Natranaeroarchaeum aerophilus]|uniref:HTH-type transcriptional regulator n=1 Tax=Natranaeroarchaeum aerophilus TaxID=2917711 RepID=A0AAE3K621_9EURY|nr:transcriptional regulator [Natranaeroarchaeum aerophilus]MCL9814511.1 transcriptional regulator [Natranaeroarchaeum aerophilus]